MPSQKNIEYLERTKERLKAGKAFYFTDFTGQSVKNLEKLRRELKKNQGHYIVLKNTLGFLALKELGFDEATTKQLFEGPTGIAVAFDDPVILAKILTNHENLKIKGSFIEGKFFATDRVAELARIPSKELLCGQVISSLNVLSNFVNVLEGIMRSLIYTIDAMKNKEAK